MSTKAKNNMKKKIEYPTELVEAILEMFPNDEKIEGYLNYVLKQDVLNTLSDPHLGKCVGYTFNLLRYRSYVSADDIVEMSIEEVQKEAFKIIRIKKLYSDYFDHIAKMRKKP